MEKGYSFYIFIILVFSFIFSFTSGCAKPPAKEVENAEKAIAEARKVEADLYVRDAFMNAENLLKEAKDLIAAKKYKEAKIAAEEAAKIAQQTVSMVETNKQKMREQTEQMIQDAQNLMEELKTLAGTAVRKKAPIDKEEIQAAIGKYELDMLGVKDQLQAQKVRQAYDQVVSLAEQIKAQKETVTAALEKK